jgi:transposase InsO family protein
LNRSPDHHCTVPSGSGADPTRGSQLFRAERPNNVWALDFQFDELADQRRLKLLNVVDEHTREALAMRVRRSCDADQVVAVIESLVATRGAPEHLRMDNGPELVAWALRDWCRLAGTATTYIEPGHHELPGAALRTGSGENDAAGNGGPCRGSTSTTSGTRSRGRSCTSSGSAS